MFRRRDCGGIEPLLWDYAADRLGDMDREKVTAHLADCSACSASATAYVAAVAAAAAGRQEAIPDSRVTWSDVTIRLSASRSAPVFRIPPSLATVGVLASVLLIITWRSLSPSNRTPAVNGPYVRNPAVSALPNSKNILKDRIVRAVSPAAPQSTLTSAVVKRHPLEPRHGKRVSSTRRWSLVVGRPSSVIRHPSSVLRPRIEVAMAPRNLDAVLPPDRPSQEFVMSSAPSAASAAADYVISTVDGRPSARETEATSW